MSEPTPEQIEAGEQRYSDWGGGHPPAGKVAAIYTAMRALERPSDEAVERLLRAAEGAVTRMTMSRRKQGRRTLDPSREETELRAAIAAMLEQSK